MKFRSILVSVAFAAAAIAAVPAVAAGNLIVNGSFETGDLTGFSHTNAPSSYGAVVINYGAAMAYPVGAFGEAVPFDSAVSASPDAVGSHGAYFVADDSVNETVSQLTPLHVGNYRVGFDVYLPFNGAANPNDAFFSATIIGINVTNFTASSTPAGTWLNFSGVAAITAAGYYQTSFVYNSFGYPSKDVVIDRVFAIATRDAATVTIPPTPTAALPEPATWGLMLVGFGFVGAAARRRAGNTVAA